METLGESLRPENIWRTESKTRRRDASCQSPLLELLCALAFLFLKSITRSDSIKMFSRSAIFALITMLIQQFSKLFSIYVFYILLNILQPIEILNYCQLGMLLSKYLDINIF